MIQMFFLHRAIMFKMTLCNFSALPLRLQVFVRRLPQRILQWKTQFAEFLFSPAFDVLQVPGQASDIENKSKRSQMARIGHNTMPWHEKKQHLM